MVVVYDELYSGLVCEDVPRVQLRSAFGEDDVIFADNGVDPWDGVKPYAEDGFVVRYCKDY